MNLIHAPSCAETVISASESAGGRPQQTPHGSPPAWWRLPSTNEMMHHKTVLTHYWSLSTTASATPGPQRPHLLRSLKILSLLNPRGNSSLGLFLVSMVLNPLGELRDAQYYFQQVIASLLGCLLPEDSSKIFPTIARSS